MWRRVVVCKDTTGWKGREYESTKRWHPTTIIHSVTSQTMNRVIAMKTSNLVCVKWRKYSILRQSLSPPPRPLGSTAQFRPWPPPQSSSIKNGWISWRLLNNFLFFTG
jgi:hypothetical protein